MEREKSLGFQILANNQKQQQRVFANFNVFLLISQPKDVFWKHKGASTSVLLVHLVKHTTKQPLEPDKEITILLMVIMQQQNKNAVYYFYMGEKTA